MIEDPYIIVECPHCKMSIIIYKSEFNCRIFRHGIYKNENKQLYQHTSQRNCELLVASGKIIGCGKPFRLNDKNEVEICGYI